MKTFGRLSALSVLLLATAACTTTTPPFGSEASWDKTAEQQIDERLAESAARAANASETLAQTERARTAPIESAISDETLRSLPPEMIRPTSIEWTGPATDLLSELSRNIGYGYDTIGQEPPVALMVSLSSVDEPAVKVFEDIGYQIAQFASVYVDPNAKRVELRYLTDHQDNQKARVEPGSAPRLGSLGPKTPGKVVRKDHLK